MTIMWIKKNKKAFYNVFKKDNESYELCDAYKVKTGYELIKSKA